MSDDAPPPTLAELLMQSTAEVVKLRGEIAVLKHEIAHLRALVKKHAPTAQMKADP